MHMKMKVNQIKGRRHFKEKEKKKKNQRMYLRNVYSKISKKKRKENSNWIIWIWLLKGICRMGWAG